MTPPLDPLTLPLRGWQLIEASAGTGKTWTLAALYLRLVLGEPDGSAEPLLPPRILVMTYTEAATAELRGRIRERLHEAALWFGGQGAQSRAEEVPANASAPRAPSSALAQADDYLQALRAAWPPALWRACAQRLELAFTPVPTADPTEIRAQALSGNVGQLQSYIASRKTASDLRSQQLSSTQESGGLKDAARLIEFIRSAAQAASIERIGDKEAPLLTNTFTVAFAFEVTKKSEFGLEWELTPYKVGFNAGSSRDVGNELVLEFGQPE